MINFPSQLSIGQIVQAVTRVIAKEGRFDHYGNMPVFQVFQALRGYRKSSPLSAGQGCPDPDQARN